MKAANEYGVKQIVVAGGCAANKGLRESMKNATDNTDIVLTFPKMKYCTDNAAMIAGVAYRYYQAGKFSDLSMDAYARFSGDLQIPME